MATNDLSGMEKADLEKLKLTSEIEESQHRMGLERVNKKKEDLKSLLAIAISVGTIVTVGLTIGTTINSYVKQKAQSEKLIVDEKMIELVKKLNSADTKEREYATVLLSPYGKSAIPILLKYLEWSDEMESTNRLIHLLKDMKQKINPKDFNDLLMNAVDEVFKEDVKNLRLEGKEQTESTEKSKTAILNYLLTLKELGEDKEKIHPMLLALKNYVKDSSPSIEEVTKKSILSRIEKIEGGLNK